MVFISIPWYLLFKYRTTKPWHSKCTYRGSCTWASVWFVFAHAKQLDACVPYEVCTLNNTCIRKTSFLIFSYFFKLGFPLHYFQHTILQFIFILLLFHIFLQLCIGNAMENENCKSNKPSYFQGAHVLYNMIWKHFIFKYFWYYLLVAHTILIRQMHYFTDRGITSVTGNKQKLHPWITAI